MVGLLFNGVPARAAAQDLSSPAAKRDDWPQDCELVRLARLPMTLKTGHVVIPASANGKPLMLGIDTGGYGSSLTKAGIGRLGLPYAAKLGAIIHAIGGAWVSEGNVRLDQFRIGDLALNGVFLPEMVAFPGVDGLIGPDILGRYDVELDFGGKSVSLFKPHPCSDHAVYWASAYAVIPFTLTDNGHVRVPVALDGRNMDAVLDTGAGISVMSLRDANRVFDLTPVSAGIEAANPVSGTLWHDRVNAYAYTFKALAIGGMTISSPRVELLDGRNFLGKDFATLVLGNDVLSHFHLYIAYRQRKLYVTDAQAH
jgi:predicted aspartyl protease